MRYDAVIIGAGAFGCSLAYHLGRAGKRVALMDRVEVASQTSPRAAGLFKHVQSTATRTAVAALSARKVIAFEQDTGLPLPAVCSGSLMVASRPAHAEHLRREVARARAWGARAELVDAATASRLMPMLRAEKLLAIAHVPDDLYIDEPKQLLDAYLQAAVLAGVDVFPHTNVTGIHVEQGRTRGVVTSRGETAAPVVVDAAGAWARAVGALAGANLPVVSLRHQLYLTDAIEGMAPQFPMIRFVDAGVYVRPARQGLMVGAFEVDPLPLDVSRREGFSMEQTPLDFSVLARAQATIEEYVPALKGSTVREHRAGLFTMTADGQFMAGPVSEVRGLWVVTGCNGSGFSFSPGLGQTVSEWIVDGVPSIDLHEFSPARGPARPLDEARLTAACVWQYAHFYDPAS
jgi:glycine/D-amino acid oxidase-like deaminating enzyme